MARQGLSNEKLWDALEQLDEEDAIELLSELPPADAAEILEEIAPELAAELIRPGGSVANIGVHGEPATLHLEDLWIRNVTIRTGLVDTYSTPTLLKLIASHQVNAGRFVTHHFALDDIIEAAVRAEQAARTSLALRLRLSVSASTMIATPPGP